MVSESGGWGTACDIDVPFVAEHATDIILCTLTSLELTTLTTSSSPRSFSNEAWELNSSLGTEINLEGSIIVCLFGRIIEVGLERTVVEQ